MNGTNNGQWQGFLNDFTVNLLKKKKANSFDLSGKFSTRKNIDLTSTNVFIH